MSAATVCRVCLANNLNLHGVQNDLQTAYERITKEKFYKAGYPLSMCYICLSVLQKCQRFMETARDTNRMWPQWYRQRIRKIVSKPLSTYSLTKVEASSMGSDVILSEDDIKMEDYSQSDYIEYDTDVLIEKLEANEHTDSDFVLDSSYSNYAEEVSNNDRQADSLFNNNIDNHKIEPKMDGAMIINLHDNDPQIYEDIEITEIKQEIDSNDEIMKFLSTNEISEDMNTIMKIEEINENYSEIFSDENSYLTEASSMIIINEETEKTYNKKIYTCDVCNESCTSISRLRRHIDKKHAKKIIKKIDKKIYSCSECTYKCNTKRSSVIHSKLHETVPLPQDQTEKMFDRSLNTFLTSSGTIEPTVCGDLKSVNRNRLKSRGKPEVLTCNICDYKTVKRNNFNRHLKSHSGERPFSCNLCNVKCTTKRGLNLHMRTHTGEKPFSCDFCQHRCVTSSDLTKHLRVHTGEKPYSCEICGYKCTRLYHLKLHMKRHMK